jgi:hypothetical protein
LEHEPRRGTAGNGQPCDTAVAARGIQNLQDAVAARYCRIERRRITKNLIAHRNYAVM